MKADVNVQGNDAAYTLQAMIGVAIKGLAPIESSRKSRTERIEEAEEEGETVEPIERDCDEWSEASESDDDGGVPVRYVEESEKRSRHKPAQGRGSGETEGDGPTGGPPGTSALW